MKCPSCGNDEAYLGFSSIDCPNSLCRYYTPSTPTTVTGITAPSQPSINPPGIRGHTSIQGHSQPIVATLNLSVDITASVVKRSSVLISIVAH
jgi:hypothetical protein